MTTFSLFSAKSLLNTSLQQATDSHAGVLPQSKQDTHAVPSMKQEVGIVGGESYILEALTVIS